MAAGKKKTQEAIGLTTMAVVVPSLLPLYLRQYRRARGLSVRDSAERAGVSSSTFHRVETGGRFDVQTLLALTAFLKTSRPARRKEKRI